MTQTTEQDQQRLQQQQKRAAQNEVERQRREVLNVGFAKLATLVPTLQNPSGTPASKRNASASLNSLAADPAISPSSTTVLPSSLPASKQTILTESCQYIVSLQQQLDNMSRALAAADSKCFSLVAELHRISCASGLAPNLDDIQSHPSSNVSSSQSLQFPPMSPVSESSEGHLSLSDHDSVSRKRAADEDIQLPSLKRPNSSPESIHIPLCIVSKHSAPQLQETQPIMTLPPILSTSPSPPPSFVSTSPNTLASTPSSRLIMKSGRPKGSLNKKTVSKRVEESLALINPNSTANGIPQLLVRVPSPQ
ncbi:UNVERIFIED_CONTAM: hypothetical protein HDU68_007596 [Siphonaria sp. JEL0065]|nr:hypothetical protein HDU68_007596 [Siphonaria sp. JEL0065]